MSPSATGGSAARSPADSCPVTLSVARSASSGTACERPTSQTSWRAESRPATRWAGRSHHAQPRRRASCRRESVHAGGGELVGRSPVVDVEDAEQPRSAAFRRARTTRQRMPQRWNPRESQGGTQDHPREQHGQDDDEAARRRGDERERKKDVLCRTTIAEGTCSACPTARSRSAKVRRSPHWPRSRAAKASSFCTRAAAI